MKPSGGDAQKACVGKEVRGRVHRLLFTNTTPFIQTGELWQNTKSKPKESNEYLSKKTFFVGGGVLGGSDFQPDSLLKTDEGCRMQAGLTQMLLPCQSHTLY